MKTDDLRARTIVMGRAPGIGDTEFAQMLATMRNFDAHLWLARGGGTPEEVKARLKDASAELGLLVGMLSSLLHPSLGAGPWPKRPDDYESRSPREQWEIDKRLGLLDAKEDP